MNVRLFEHVAACSATTPIHPIVVDRVACQSGERKRVHGRRNSNTGGYAIPSLLESVVTPREASRRVGGRVNAPTDFQRK